MGIKIFYMFVVRTQYIYHEATHHKQKTETKIRGRRTDASSEIYSMPRMDWVRSDLPSLFNFNSFFMRTQNDKSTTSASENGTFVSEIQDNHKANRQSVINDLFNRPINQLVNDFMVEMDAKNKAYYFILESGMFMQFRDYCLTNQNRG